MQDSNSPHTSFLISGFLIALFSVFLLVRYTTDFKTMKGSLTTLSSSKEVADEIKKTPDQFAPSKSSRKVVAGIEHDHQSGGSNGLEGTEDQLKDVTTRPRFQLGLRLVGTVLAGKETSYALIEEETSNDQNLYSVGDFIKGAKLLKIDKESVVFAKEGRAHILKVARGSYTEPPPSEILDGDEPLFKGKSAEFPFFEPVISKTGPTAETEDLYQELPDFIPFESDSGPPDA